MIEGAGIPRQGNPVLAGGEEAGVVTSGTFSPSLEIGIGMAYVRADLAEPGTEVEIDVRGKRRPARIASKPLYRKGEVTWPRRTTPTTCATTTSTTGPGWRATTTPSSGSPGTPRTALGEVVFYDPPEVGATIAKDSSYAEVESVKAVSDVIAPMSGEIVEVNDALGDAPEKINEDPYGEGWLVKVKLSRPRRGRGAARRRRIPQAAGGLGEAPPPASVALAG